jgi:hypothetical protein
MSFDIYIVSPYYIYMFRLLFLNFLIEIFLFIAIRILRFKLNIKLCNLIAIIHKKLKKFIIFITMAMYIFPEIIPELKNVF